MSLSILALNHSGKTPNTGPTPGDDRRQDRLYAGDLRTDERQRLKDLPSVGSRGDLLQTTRWPRTIIGLYKTELVYHHGPWSRLEDIELATLEWVWWFNNHRLLKPIGLVPPARVRGGLLP